MRVALIDYGAGNLTSVRKALAAVGADVFGPSSPVDLDTASAIVVPGVGHFAATATLNQGWRDAIRRRIDARIPLLGICLGMQWLFEGSTEAPDVSGLGVIAGRCQRIDAARPLKVPHVGWNTLQRQAWLPPSGGRLMNDINDNAYVYFTHGFAAPVTPECVAVTTHGETFAAVVERERVFGVQFHPEKSSEAGLRILTNFMAEAAR